MSLPLTFPGLSLNTSGSQSSLSDILQLSPYTPSLTNSPSVGSSASSPGLYPDSIFPLAFNTSRRLSVDSAASIPGSAWPSPILAARSPPGTEYNPIHIPDSKAHLFDSAPPKKRPKRSSKLAHEEHSFDSAMAPAVVSIPPAHASDLPFDPSKKPARKRGQAAAKARRKQHPASTASSSAPPSTPSSPQPMKFRFVSVQHHSAQTQPDDPDEDMRVEFEEHMEEDIDDGPFEHGPSELPPRPYPGGEYATSPLQPKPKTGKIPASSLDFLPVLEARFARLETAIERYVKYRAEQALRNSILPAPAAATTARLPTRPNASPKGRQRTKSKLIPMSNQ